MVPVGGRSSSISNQWGQQQQEEEVLPASAATGEFHARVVDRVLQRMEQAFTADGWSKQNISHRVELVARTWRRKLEDAEVRPTCVCVCEM
jgi:ribosome-binding protein aMBF1 (putative translation factor)